MNYAASVFAADLDGDGDIDVLSASLYDDKIAWYENTDGLGTFGGQRVISTVADRAWDVFAADLDGDGDVDVLSASEGDDKIAWYENTDGLGTFGGQRIITATVDYPISVFAVDLDGDGDIDVLSASYYDHKIAWYENTDGLGNFGNQTIITSNARGAQSVFATDLDRDGDMDVLSASSYDDKIAWYANEPDCNGNGVNDACEADCNHNGRHDDCDLADGTSADCNANGVPDECEGGCNYNRQPDECDLADGTSADCDGSGVPDECEGGCNHNHQPDECDLADGTSADCDGSGVPDECEGGCNHNHQPDECDLADGISADCNSNGIPDECETDCNRSGRPDDCDIADGTSMDCQPNGSPDECDLPPEIGWLRQSEDIDGNGVPDECQPCEAVIPFPQPLVSLEAVAVNGQAIDPTNCLTAAPGDIVEAEIRVSGWAPYLMYLRSYQATLELHKDVISGDGGVILPLGWDAPLEDVLCSSDADCPPAFPSCYVFVCPPSQQCVPGVCLGLNHNPSLGVDIQRGRADFVLSGLNPLSGVGHSDLGYYVFFGTTSSGLGADDPGPGLSRYAGTLRLKISADARGQFRFSFDADGNCEGRYGCQGRTMFADIHSPGYSLIPSLHPLVVEVVDSDCNNNSLGDSLEVLQGLARDCDGDRVLDECELAACAGDRACQDCNLNGVPDGCDMADGTSTDANHDGRPDDCFVAIPTVSEWGLVVLTLLLMTGAKIGLGRRPIVG